MEQCIVGAVNYLNDAVPLGWGSYNGSSWDIVNPDAESLVLTAAVLEFLGMQIVRLPIALSFGDIGARVSWRGASGERGRAIVEIKAILFSKIDEIRSTNAIIDVVR